MSFQSKVLLELEPVAAEWVHSHDAVIAVWMLLWGGSRHQDLSHNSAVHGVASICSDHWRY